MISNETVFIVGAGASFELGFPTGQELKSRLAQMLVLGERDNFTNSDLDRAADGLVARLPHDQCDLATAARDIVAALPFAQSIDNYLHTHRDRPDIVGLGKIAIAAAIIDAEQRSVLMTRETLSQRHRNRLSGVTPSPTLDDPKLLKSWYAPLLRLLVTGANLNELSASLEKLTFITFNYDRSLEHFLVNAIGRFFLVSEEEACEIVGRATFIHAYGRTGNLPWEAGHLQVPYGGRRGSNDLFAISQGIRTFTEAADSETAGLIHHALERAYTLVFTGFGFIEQNLALLQTMTAIQVVYATTFGISDADLTLIEPMIRTVISPSKQTFAEMRIERGTCSDLFSNYWFHLSRTL